MITRDRIELNRAQTPLTTEQRSARNRADIPPVATFGYEVERLQQERIAEDRFSLPAQKTLREPAKGIEPESTNIHARKTRQAEMDDEQKKLNECIESLKTQNECMKKHISTLESNRSGASGSHYVAMVTVDSDSYEDTQKALQKEINTLIASNEPRKRKKRPTGAKGPTHKKTKLDWLKESQIQLLAGQKLQETFENLQQSHEDLTQQKNALDAKIKTLQQRQTPAVTTQEASVQTTSVQATSVQATSLQATSVQATSLQATSVQATSVQATSVQATSVQATSVQATEAMDTDQEHLTHETMALPESSDDESTSDTYEPNSDELNDSEDGSEKSELESSPATIQHQPSEESQKSSRRRRPVRGTPRKSTPPVSQTETLVISNVTEPARKTDFEKQMSADEQQDMAKWLSKSKIAQITLNTKIRQGDQQARDRAACLLIVMMSTQQKWPLRKISDHLGRLKFNFAIQGVPTTEACRMYIRRMFSPADTEQILGLSCDRATSSSGPALRTKEDSHSLLARIRNNTADAKESLDTYVVQTFYDVKRQKKDPSAPFGTVVNALRKVPNVQGTKGSEIDRAWVYDYMVKNDLFKDDGADYYLSPKQLIPSLNSEGNKLEEGKARLNQYAAAHIKVGKTASAILRTLVVGQVPNFITPGRDWKKEDVVQLACFQTQAETGSLEDCIDSWYNKEKGSAEQLLKAAFEAGNLRVGEVVRYLREKYSWSIDGIRRALVDLKPKTFTVNIDDIRSALYQLCKTEPLATQAELLEGAVHIFLYRAEAAYTAGTQNTLHEQFEDEDYVLLANEFASRSSKAGYTQFWKKLLNDYPFTRIHRIYLRESLKKSDATRLLERLKMHVIRRHPYPDTNWTRPIMLQHLLKHEITDIICGNGTHIAVAMATSGVEGLNEIYGTPEKSFSSFLEDELKRHKYEFGKRKQLENSGYLQKPE